MTASPLPDPARPRTTQGGLYVHKKKNLLKGQEVLYLREGLSPYQRPSTDQHRALADTGPSMSGTQILLRDSGESNPNVFNHSGAPY